MTSNSSPFSTQCAVPFDPDYPLFNVGGGSPRAWEFNGWKAESLSWKRTCYIHGGLSGPAQFRFTGPDAKKFLESICVNSFGNFQTGAAKHAVMCNDQGLISAHGVLQRLADNDFRLFVSGPWARYLHSKCTERVQLDVENNYLFQIAGPNSLQTLEAATGESLRDIAFLRFRNSKIAGKNVQVMRVGMSGTLAYELHGPNEEGAEVYNAVLAAGRAFGIEQLGWLTYPVNHIEAGFPQQNWTFTSGAYNDPGFVEYTARVKPIRFGAPLFSGSVDPADIRSRQRTVTEVGWQRSVKLDHDFVGRAAVENEIADPKKTIVTLVWNSDDVVDIYASMFRQGEEYKYIELPSAPNYRKVLAHADHVLKDGQRVGISAGIAFSYYYREMISHCVIKRDTSSVGTNVTIDWGDFRGRIKEVRATVARYPYLNESRNQDAIV